jgi:citrate lyase subunit beta/citryl-CoA lyase
LYVPGSNPRAIEKARTIAADVLIFDLEDSVPPAMKDSAREAVAQAVSELAGSRREIVVRINALDTVWVPRDIATLVAAKPDALLLPKVARPDDIRRIRAALGAAQAPKTIALWAMIETPAAILNAAAIAAVAAMPAPPIACFVIGTNDLAAEIGAPQRPGRPALLPHIAHALLAARAHGLAVLDGTWNDLDDRKGLQGECRQGREMGFDGKTLVHPTQVTIANDVYAPDPEELAWSRKVVDAFAVPGNSALEVLQLSGRMVERLHERSARRMIALADAIAALDKEMAALAGATARRRLTPAARSGS